MAGDWSSVSRMRESVHTITKLAHFWSDTGCFPPLRPLYTPLYDLDSAGKTVLNATVPTSPPGDHSLAESRCVVCDVICLMLNTMYNLAKAYRNIKKSIANRRVEDW